MISYAILRAEDHSVLAQLLAETFHGELSQTKLWVERSGLENWRVVKDDPGALLGGLLCIPMAQWFGGEKVTMTGLAGVAVSPEARGRKVGQTLLRETLTEMRAHKVGLSALYGSTTSFYRRCGYQRAGSRFMAEVKLTDLDYRGGPLEVRLLDSETARQAEALQERFVRAQGCLVRGPYVWNRLRGPRGKTALGYGFFRGENLEGYTYLIKDCGSDFDCTLEATDLVLTTPDAVSTFLGFLAGYRALIGKARWPSPAVSPVLLRLPEPWIYKVNLFEHWMLRIVDLEQALTQRGYAPHLECELHLAVDDPWLAENSGTWILSVNRGKAQVQKGGRGDLKVDIGALASLYSGFLTSDDLVLAGIAQGTPEALRLANCLFGGVTPQLLDFF